jgi:uncharacterized protein YndB with AHSA1/START domain
VTEPEQLAQWFPSTIEGERAAGAALRFTFPGAVGEPIEGRMLAYEPPELIELRWGTDILRLELRALEGGTELILLDTLEERGKAARDGAGWHTCLEALEGVLAGHAEPRAALARERWAEVHPQYVRRFGPEAATIGPPSDE